MEELTITELVKDVKSLTDKQVENLWMDWFCNESQLIKKGRVLLNKVNQIKDSTKFNNDESCLWFKNNCPCIRSLYDDFRICDNKTGKILFTVGNSGHDYIKNLVNKGEATGRWFIYDVSINDYVLENVTWKEVKDWFNN